VDGPLPVIGIDLGTTNCALAYTRDGIVEMFAIPQFVHPGEVRDELLLPSFLFLDESGPIAGVLAQRKGLENAGRLVSSAKSWLSHAGVDRTAAILPPNAPEGVPRISPVEASRQYLEHLRDAWNGKRPEQPFDSHQVLVTVPASFDAIARDLTQKAAEQAGYRNIVLLEEPQAAFYAWIEGNPDWRESISVGDLILVIDIGGGTTDFSLIAVKEDAGEIALERIAVGDHILLGGDNIDLAIAYLLEPRLTGERGKLSGTQWGDLVARCRDLKEKVLTSEGWPDEPCAISLPGRGSGLVAALRTAQLMRAEIRALLLDGFFPECGAQAYPYRAQAALREWGLPYASDCAVTRHLADFLRGRPRVDAILFNGGSLRPAFLRERICQQVAKWQGGLPPLALENADAEFAVARGAALFGKFLHRRTERIEAGAPRAVFLEVLRRRAPEAAEPAPPSLVCVLPRGASSELRFEITGLPLEVQTNRPARFQAYYSTRDDKSKAGDVADWSEEDHHALPPLETVINITDSAPGTTANTLPVTLIASVNELGLLQVSCVSADPSITQCWPLEFNLRPHEQDGQDTFKALAISVDTKPNVTAQALEAARTRIQHLFNRPSKQREMLTATRLLRNLEQLLEMPKSEWNAALVRALWPALESCMVRRKESPDHEEAWLILAGFLLRPGFGAAADHFRIDGLWRLREHGLYFAGKRSKVQEYVLWRRVAGGLERQRQEQILAPELDKIRTQKKLAPELIRLAGSLERLPIQTKTELANLFIGAASNLAQENKHCAPYLGALGHILSRAPLYAGPETVVSPDLVERAYEAFRILDWAAPELAELQTLFLRAARVAGSRSFDLPQALRHRIAAELETAGVSPQRTGKLKEFTPVGGAERISLHDESLPPGLILTELVDNIRN
jgi:molecular chaperone DnaK (HSP70)